MWFQKDKKPQKDFPRPGKPAALDGQTAVYMVENMASEAIMIQTLPEFAELTGPLVNLSVDPGENSSRQVVVRQSEQLRNVFILADGYTLMGMRSAVMAGSFQDCQGTLAALAGKRLATVINLTPRAATRQATPMSGSHDDYYGAAASGLFQLFAANVQESADFTLIAHRIAELSMTPGIVAQDFYHTSHSVQNLLMPDQGLVSEYLGSPADIIDTPTPAQSLLFGEKRRRIPLLLDRDQPAGIGGVQDGDSYFKSLIAQRPFFYSHIDSITAAAMDEFGDLTGRYYRKVSGYRHEDAEVLVIAQGAITETLQEIVDYLRKHEKIKVGIARISMFRPFPGAEVAALLKGKKVVTVLERTDTPLAEDLPLAGEIRAATGKALENGRNHGKPLHKDYPVYERLDDCPRICTGIYGVGTTLPPATDLIATCRNMLEQDNLKSLFYIGTSFRAPDRRFPQLQTRQQVIDKHYPQLRHQILSGDGEVPPQEHSTRALQIHSLSIQGGLFAGNIFARNLAHTMGWKMRTFPSGGLEPGLQPASLTIVKSDAEPKAEPEVLDAVLVSAYKLMENVVLISRIREDGILIIESNKTAHMTWRGLSRPMQEAIRARNLQVYAIDAAKIAADTASNPSFIDQLAVWALIGAYIKSDTGSEIDQQAFLVYLQTQLEKIFGPDHILTRDIITVINRATETLNPLPWESYSTQQRSMVPEPEAPWNVEQAVKGNAGVFDVTRFWQSVGYLYDTGQTENTLIDPFIATGIMPSRSSAFRDISPYRLRIPNWLPENCTGCGLCWAYCPESALPPSIQDLSSIIKTMIHRCEQQGALMTQMNRVGEPLAKQAHKLLAADGLHQYLTLGSLLRNALVQLMERLNIEGSNRDDLIKEFKTVCQPLEELKIAKTESFFTAPDKKQKGDGLLLTISLNPMSCTGCGSCIENCPEFAFEWREQSAEMLALYRHNWQLQKSLPKPDSAMVNRFIEPDQPQTSLNRLLLGDVYHSLVGGDGAIPGNSLKTSVHQLTATLESIMYARFESHCQYLDRLITGLEDKIQGKVTGTMNINDFEGFTRRLDRLRDQTLSAEQLAHIVGEDGSSRVVDPDQLSRQSHLLEELKEIRQLYRGSLEGNGRARMVLAIDPGAASFWNGIYPYNPHAQPWVCHLPGAAALLAEGIFGGITRNLAQEIKNYRQAELELNDDYDAVEFDSTHKSFNWKEFTANEQQLIPPVLVVCRAGNVGGETLSRLLSSEYPIKVVMLNNEGLSVPEREDGPGNNLNLQSLSLWEKESDLLTLMHTGTFVLQTTAANPEHLIQGLAEAMDHNGPVLLHIYAPHPQASEIAPEKVIKQAALACHSRVFPLFKIKPDAGGINILIDNNPDPDQDWVMRELSVIEPSTEKTSITVPFTAAHWAIQEARFQGHFRILPRGHVSDKLKPLVEYIDLEPQQRQSFDPYIDFTDTRQRHYIAIVSGAMVKAVEDTRELWRYIQKLAGSQITAIPDREIAADVQEPQAAPPAPVPDLTAYQQLTDRLLALCGYSEDPEFFNQSLRQFIYRDDKNISKD